MSRIINVVDLFCGCGGLSLGFDLFNGSLEFKTQMALDNYEPTVKCYNRNYTNSKSKVPVARVCDLTWFNHPSEVLFYYLLHYSYFQSDKQLLDSLHSSDIDTGTFLSTLKKIDKEFDVRRSELVSTLGYDEALSKVDERIFNLAIFNSFLTKLGLISLKNASINPKSVPWTEEYNLKDYQELPRYKNSIIDEIKENVERFWNNEIFKLDEASQKDGQGQNKDVAKRLKSLLDFLKSDVGEKFKEIWIDWRVKRDSCRAEFFTRVYTRLVDLYSNGREVQLLLGGPPCKGFSRIGRAVIENLRNQGVHAWASNDYGDERNALLHKYVLFLEALKPNVFIFENVAQFQSELKTPAGTLDAAEMLSNSIKDLSSDRLNYEIKSKIVKAKHYAIPQDRQRFILVGFNTEVINKFAVDEFFSLKDYSEEVPLLIALQGLESPGEFSPTCNSSHKSKAYTLVDPSMPPAHVKYINWIRQPKPGDRNSPSTTDAHIVRQMRRDDLGLIMKFAPGQRWMDYKLKQSETLNDLNKLLHELDEYFKFHKKEEFGSIDLINSLLKRVNDGLLLRLIMEEVSPSHHLLLSNYLAKGNESHGDWFERLTPDETSKTIVAHIGKDTYGYIHPFLNRAISIREAARIQSFPDFFSFSGIGVVDAYSMIGNAVPPLLANLFATQLTKLHEKYNIFSNNDANKDDLNVSNG